MEEKPPLPVLLLFGPTASGKTALLERLFAPSADGGALVPAEIISADSMQIYRGMDIGTAKPDPSLLSRLPHHLIDIRNPDEAFNVGDFVRLADEAALDISSRGLLPVISGGTGFYLKHFVQGLPETPPADAAIREALQEELQTRGAQALMDELSSVDPTSGSRIHLHDEYRILRALEVYRSSGRPLSSFSAAPSPEASGRPRYRFLLVGLERERGELYRRIDERSALMFSLGLRAEVASLLSSGYRSGDPGLRAIGYQEFLNAEGTLVEDDAAVLSLVARNSRRYAKRQVLFFSSLPAVHWLDASMDALSLHESLLSLVQAFLSTDKGR